ncbi:nicotinate-nucleotide--dimethylbenzimidazole phosphoribosyltransferase [Dasania sp. GY-MA-18]|uniref:Nicotinate-nucleotide--dimethylbenzimidazole phosphoribosyltransferase n=1 Tax=Dasania phycosphaerae TaxID=2950436 RepID=A0A9J6RJQ4_9GAMM|nr:MULTISPECIES: nicotinate-nucleotide--dimethylbenzimidazole phosphoribosyltransferase [Dasania]MCR8922490.1 nicotinate-nucleotide--dimethylbenzimidazole phosphoribosyltransferase [Dasania sp. GY-MA-18]MCZ0864918.1 nicotinate-nucleotide--dimethylbenzimidazole phosphoribosyltransferase [Dasania phycosphaerae]MCZ0868646.1 nicotinate-nucleotide--dimethylbenzimidazole phosphoribosyltransferase [Dasania phycosphaerae]
MDWFLQQAKVPSDIHRAAATQHQSQLTKPAGSLGQLETLAITLASLQGSHHPQLKNIHIHIFAADHGIAAENVSAFPQAVTAQMVQNFSSGGAAIAVIAQTLNADLAISNVGTVQALPELPKVLDQRIAAGTANFAHGPAMQSAQLLAALEVGRNSVSRQQDLWLGGEMGIANTSSATALACALLQVNAQQLVGPGTGIDAAAQQHKAQVINAALALHKANSNSPLNNLQNLGGLEIAALVGGYIRAAQLGVPALVDGFICTVAAAYAIAINPSVKPWLLLSHQSAEPGQQALFEGFAYPPLINMGMRLGEGSGAAVCLPLLKLACDLHNNMATFADAGVANKD